MGTVANVFQMTKIMEMEYVCQSDITNVSLLLVMRKKISLTDLAAVWSMDPSIFMTVQLMYDLH